MLAIERIYSGDKKCAVSVIIDTSGVLKLYL